MPQQSLDKVEHFHRNKRKIKGVILSKVDKHEVIYGARALNKRFPPHLDRHTEDFDIFSPTPKKDAQQTERALDRKFGGDYFYVEAAQHPGTWKVKSHVNKVGYADYTKPEERVPYDTIGGRKYVKLSHVKKKIKATLKDKESAYRHDKDRDALNRIKVYERGGTRKPKRRKVIKQKTRRKRSSSSFSFGMPTITFKRRLF